MEKLGGRIWVCCKIKTSGYGDHEQDIVQASQQTVRGNKQELYIQYFVTAQQINLFQHFCRKKNPMIS